MTVNKRARFVDEEKCNGCGDCEAACPVTVTDTYKRRTEHAKGDLPSVPAGDSQRVYHR